ncbi:hypothetical protein V8E55_011760 [Tylopilus felleus]
MPAILTLDDLPLGAGMSVPVLPAGSEWGVWGHKALSRKPLGADCGFVTLLTALFAKTHHASVLNVDSGSVSSCYKRCWLSLFFSSRSCRLFSHVLVSSRSEVGVRLVAFSSLGRLHSHLVYRLLIILSVHNAQILLVNHKEYVRHHTSWGVREQPESNVKICSDSSSLSGAITDLQCWLAAAVTFASHGPLVSMHRHLCQPCLC